MLTAVETLGERIRRLRTQAGYETQSAFAEALEVSQSRVSDWERGRYKSLDLKNVLKVVRVLKSRIDDFVAGLDERYDAFRRDLPSHIHGVQQHPPRQEGAADVAPSARVLKQRESSYAQALDEIHKRSAEILVLIERVRPDAKTRTTAHHSASRRGGR